MNIEGLCKKSYRAHGSPFVNEGGEFLFVIVVLFPVVVIFNSALSIKNIYP
jgi:hypothetical protein